MDTSTKQRMGRSLSVGFGTSWNVSWKSEKNCPDSMLCPLQKLHQLNLCWQDLFTVSTSSYFMYCDGKISISNQDVWCTSCKLFACLSVNMYHSFYICVYVKILFMYILVLCGKISIFHQDVWCALIGYPGCILSYTVLNFSYKQPTAMIPKHIGCHFQKQMTIEGLDYQPRLPTFFTLFSHNQNGYHL